MAAYDRENKDVSELYTGTGELFLEPSFGGFYVFDGGGHTALLWSQLFPVKNYPKGLLRNFKIRLIGILLVKIQKQKSARGFCAIYINPEERMNIIYLKIRKV